MKNIRAKAEEAIKHNIDALESTAEMINAIKQLTTADDIMVGFNSLDTLVAEKVLRMGVSMIINVHAVETLKNVELN